MSTLKASCMPQHVSFRECWLEEVDTLFVRRVMQDERSFLSLPTIRPQSSLWKPFARECAWKMPTEDSVSLRLSQETKTELSRLTTDGARSEFAQQSNDREFWLDPEDVGGAVLYAVTAPSHVGINEILIEPRGAPA